MVETMALIDPGAAGNFFDINFANFHKLPLLPRETRVAVAALDGRPLGTGLVKFTTQDLTLKVGSLHTEITSLFAIDSPQNPAILGLPWLERHNPLISWTTKQIQQWSERCQKECLQLQHRVTTSASPSSSVTPTMSDLPMEYQDLTEAFSKSKASQLPPHRSSDCAIDLLPGAIGLRASLDHSSPLHQPGSSLSRRRTGVCDPCIDYRSLNDVTVKFRYPLPLVPSALEQLRTANILPSSTSAAPII